VEAVSKETKEDVEIDSRFTREDVETESRYTREDVEAVSKETKEDVEIDSRYTREDVETESGYTREDMETDSRHAREGVKAASEATKKGVDDTARGTAKDLGSIAQATKRGVEAASNDIKSEMKDESKATRSFVEAYSKYTKSGIEDESTETRENVEAASNSTTTIVGNLLTNASQAATEIAEQIRNLKLADDADAARKKAMEDEYAAFLRSLNQTSSETTAAVQAISAAQEQSPVAEKEAAPSEKGEEKQPENAEVVKTEADRTEKPAEKQPEDTVAAGIKNALAAVEASLESVKGLEESYKRAGTAISEDAQARTEDAAKAVLGIITKPETARTEYTVPQLPQKPLVFESDEALWARMEREEAARKELLEKAYSSSPKSQSSLVFESDEALWARMEREDLERRGRLDAELNARLKRAEDASKAATDRSGASNQPKRSVETLASLAQKAMRVSLGAEVVPQGQEIVSYMSPEKLGFRQRLNEFAADHTFRITLNGVTITHENVGDYQGDSDAIIDRLRRYYAAELHSDRGARKGKTREQIENDDEELKEVNSQLDQLVAKTVEEPKAPAIEWTNPAQITEADDRIRQVVEVWKGTPQPAPQKSSFWSFLGLKK
jgi:hypothetical protein